MFETMAAMPLEFNVTIFFIFGALLGSFANVVILRVPAGESVVKPRSRCGACGKAIAAYDNIPILSWFILRGRCRNCKAKYSFRYPLVELVTAGLFALAFWKFGYSWNLAEALIFILGLVIVSGIDIDHFLLPDKFTLPGIVIGLLGAYLNPDRTFLDALMGVLFGGGFLWSLAYFYYLVRKEEGMGGGDIKLLAWIGAVLGWQAIPFVILSSSVLGSIVGLGLALRKNEGMKTVIPFGPYLALGALVSLFAGQFLSQTYLGWMFPQYQP